MEPNFQHLGLAVVENGVGRSLKSFRLPAEAQRPVGQPTELELRVIGATLVARANGFEAFRMEDSNLTQGHPDIRLDPGVVLHAVQTLDLSKGAAAPPSATTPSPGAAGLSPSTEPWQDVLRDPAKLVLSGGAARISEGLRFTGPSVALLHPSQDPRNDGAIRVRATFGDAHLFLHARQNTTGH